MKLKLTKQTQGCEGVGGMERVVRLWTLGQVCDISLSAVKCVSLTIRPVSLG